MFDQPRQIQKILSNYDGLWAIAGGWAIDLFLDSETREHQDVEIIIPRLQQLKLKDQLRDWRLQYFTAENKANSWQSDEFLELPIHEIQAKGHAGFQLEILLNEIENDTWRFRRNPSVVYPLGNAITASAKGIPILSPEVVLLFKAKNFQTKDALDLKNVLPQLSAEKKQWLKKSISITHGQHEWLSKI